MFYNNGGEGRKVGWYSDKESNEGVYTITIRGEAGCKIEEVVYTVTVRSQCYSVPLAIEEFGESVFADTVMSVWAPPVVIEWDDFLLV